MADDYDDETEVLPPARAHSEALLPSEIPARMLKLLARNVTLVEALQAKVAGALKAAAFDDGHSAVSALGTLTKSNDNLMRLYQLFEPRSDAAKEVSKSDGKAARASAEKLLALMQAESAQEAKVAPQQSKAGAARQQRH